MIAVDKWNYSVPYVPSRVSRLVASIEGHTTVRIPMAARQPLVLLRSFLSRRPVLLHAGRDDLLLSGGHLSGGSSRGLGLPLALSRLLSAATESGNGTGARWA